MAGQPRRVYAPALEPAPKGPPPKPPGRGWAGIAFALVVTLGSIAFIWSAWVGGSSPPVVKAPTQPFKVAAPRPDAAPPEQAKVYDVLETAREPAGKAAATAPAPAAAKPEPVLAPSGAQPDGPYLVQIAALKSFEAAQALGPKLSKAQPAAYKGVTFDVQRVERDGGVFFRVRAGYFADWAEASLYCNRLASLKQDCIVVAR